jgi:hypothetical protein
MNQMTVQGSPIQLVETHGEPTVRDVDLGARLGMKRPTNIRRVIERNRVEVEGYGSLHAASAMIEAGKGAQRETVEYHLTEEQALCVCQLSRAPNAPAVRRMLIEAFTAYRRGHLVPELDRSAVGGIVKGVTRKAIADVLPAAIAHALGEMLQAMIEARLSSDPKMVATADFMPAVQVAIDRKVAQKGRRRIVALISNRLSRFCEAHDYRIRRDWSGRKLFDRAAVRHWLAEGGWSVVQDQIDTMNGQSVMRLVPRVNLKPEPA